MAVAYNPYDANQARLLAAISLSEVGRHPNALNLGNSPDGRGVDLSGAPRNQYGFPIWQGQPTPDGRGSRAAGFFQFQPGTWESYAKQYDLDFQDASDQKAAAWYLAQDTYKKEKGGDLSAALERGEYSSIESALGRTQWIGARGKLAEFLSGGKGATLPDGRAPVSEDTSGGIGETLSEAAGAFAGSIGDLFNPFKNLGGFQRWAILAGGLVIIGIAVWRLLADAGVAPSATQVATSVIPAGRALSAATKFL